MTEVYAAANPVEAHVVAGYLRANGIEAVVAGETLWAARGGVPLDAGTSPTVRVAEADLESARKLLADRPKGVNPAQCADCGYDLTKLTEPRCPECGREFTLAKTWRCPGCGEDVEEQFAACWQCGADRPDGG